MERFIMCESPLLWLASCWTREIDYLKAAERSLALDKKENTPRSGGAAAGTSGRTSRRTIEGHSVNVELSFCNVRLRITHLPDVFAMDEKTRKRIEWKKRWEAAEARRLKKKQEREPAFLKAGRKGKLEKATELEMYGIEEEDEPTEELFRQEPTFHVEPSAADTVPSSRDLKTA